MNAEERDGLKQALTLLFFIAGFVTLAMLCGSLCGCAAGRPASYEAALVACNQTAHSLAESLACEDRVRAQFNRPPRDAGKE